MGVFVGRDLFEKRSLPTPLSQKLSYQGKSMPSTPRQNNRRRVLLFLYETFGHGHFVSYTSSTTTREPPKLDKLVSGNPAVVPLPLQRKASVIPRLG